ncbi:MAG: hypothetical protein P8020_17485 [Acidobacteriota bacterium]|jgi:hypothetical protein
MDKFLVSMMRFSTAMTLFGLEQLQGAMSSIGSGEDLTAPLARFQEAMDTFSDAVMKQIDDKKKETIENVTRVSEDTLHRTFSGMTPAMVDPREMVRVTTDMMKKTSDTVVHWMQTEGAGKEESDEAQPASDALGGGRRTKAKAS